jgi:hypothetical protein
MPGSTPRIARPIRDATSFLRREPPAPGPRYRRVCRGDTLWRDTVWAGHRPDPGRWPAVLPVVAAIGVVAYAHRGRRGRARPKDIFLLKNAYVAGGITGFAVCVVFSCTGASETCGRSRAPRAAVRGRALADAALCDLDDRGGPMSDSGTATARDGCWDANRGLEPLALWCRPGPCARRCWLTPFAPGLVRVAWATATSLVRLSSCASLGSPGPRRPVTGSDIRFAVEPAGRGRVILCFRS